MGVEMDRQADLLLQRREQAARRLRPHQPGHVLDAENVAAGALQLLRQPDVIGEVVFRPRRVEQVAGVADRALAQLVRLDHRVERDAHVLHPVEAVEDAEQVDAVLRRAGDEVAHHIVGIVGIADAIGAAQQHLQQDVGRPLAHRPEPLPGILGEEAHGDVEGRPAPAFERKELRQPARIGLRHRDDVERAHARGEQRLVGVAHRRVGDERPSLRLHPVGEALRTELVEKLLRALLRLALVDRRAGRRRVGVRAGASLGLRVAVDGDVGDIGEQLGRPVAAGDLGEQRRGLVDEARRVAVGPEIRMAR